MNANADVNADHEGENQQKGLEANEEKVKAGRAGGLARKRKLSSEQRSEIASMGGKAKAAKLPRATHSGPLAIGDVVLQCAVLDNGVRVLTQDGFLVAMGRTGNPKSGHGGVAFDTPVFLSANNLKPYVSDELRSSSAPILFEALGGGGRQGVAYGYRAELLSDVCWVFINAQLDKKLARSQDHIADRCKALVRAFGKVGIIALVDEATGYQADRDAADLRRLLEEYIVEEMRPWVRTFPTEFFKQVCRLHEWDYRADARTPRYVGKFINHYIYGALPPAVLPTLREKNPVVGSRRKHKNFQFLTEDVGNLHLSEQIRAVTMLMKGADNKAAFERSFNRVFPSAGVQQELPLHMDVTAPPPRNADEDA